jgi:hypothetical protein
MAMYSQTSSNATPSPTPTAATTPSPPIAPAAQSEARLTRRMQALSVKRANIRLRGAASSAENLSAEAPAGEEENRRIAEEAERQARETELNAWLATGCIPTGTDATLTEVLSHYKVCLAYSALNYNST